MVIFNSYVKLPEGNSFTKKHNRLFPIWGCLKMGPHGQLNGEDHHCPMGLGAPMGTLFSDTPISHINLVNISPFLPQNAIQIH